MSQTHAGSERIIALLDSLERADGDETTLRRVVEQLRSDLAQHDAWAEDRLKMAVDAAGIGVWEYHAETDRVVWNNHLARIVGLTTSHLEGPPSELTSRIHPDDFADAEARLDIALAGAAGGADRSADPGAYEKIHRIIWPDGTVRWVAAKGRCQFDSAGRPVRMSGTVVDITDQQQHLEAAERRLHAAVENMPDLVVIYDAELRVLYANHRLSIGELSADAELASRWMPSIRHAFESGVTQTADVTISLPQGDRHLTVTAVPLVSAAGAVREVMGIIHDDTVRRDALAAARDSEAKFRLALAGAPLTVYANDRQLRYTWIYKPRFGFTVEQVLGRTDAELLPDAPPHELIALKKRVLDTGIGTREQLTFMIRGHAFTVDLAIEPQRDAAGDVIGIIVASVDVTDLVRTRREAETANAAKDRFLAVLSHELRTPLMPVLAAAQLLEADAALPDAHRQSARMIHRNIALEARLIDDLLDHTRVTRGKMQLHCERVRIHQQINDVLHICAEDLAERQMNVSLLLQAECDQVIGDPARLQQVLWNLVKNAIKFTPSNGRLEIRTLNHRDAIEIAVVDSGVGIDPGRIGSIFDAFEQGGRDVTQQYGGLGLGLAISRALVEAHRGKIVASSEGTGRGATMTVTLPTIEAAASAVSSCSQTESASEARAEDGAVEGRHILIVDDHADTREVFSLLLETIGCRSTSAGSVAEALEAAASNTFDVVISDIGLPDGSGLELMRELRSRYQLKGIALSGYGMEEDLARSKAAGFDAHLTKPVALATLHATLRSILSS